MLCPMSNIQSLTLRGGVCWGLLLKCLTWNKYLIEAWVIWENERGMQVSKAWDNKKDVDYKNS